MQKTLQELRLKADASKKANLERVWFAGKDDRRRRGRRWRRFD